MTTYATHMVSSTAAAVATRAAASAPAWHQPCMPSFVAKAIRVRGNGDVFLTTGRPKESLSP